MEDKVVKDWLDIAPAYINFALKFFRSPKDAFEGVSGSSKVSSDITGILLGGIALAYLIVIVAAPPEMVLGTGRVAEFFSELDPKLLPVAALLVAVAVRVVSHVAGKVFARFSEWGRGSSPGKWDPKLGGTVEDSVNAALGFVAVFAPLLVSVLFVAEELWVDSRVLTGLLGVSLAVFVIAYFPLSLSSAHPNTGVWQAALAFAGGIVMVTLPFTFVG